jgi:hypothetical protein
MDRSICITLHPVWLESLIEDLVFFSNVHFCILYQKSRVDGIWIYFCLQFNSIYQCVFFVPIPYCFITKALCYNLKLGMVIGPAVFHYPGVFCYLEDCFYFILFFVLFSVCFHMTVKIVLSESVKNCVRMLMRIAMTPYFSGNA